MGRPARSTTVTETLKPISWHFSIAALAIGCAIAREIFRSVTRPCACAGDHSAVASAIAPRIFNVEDMELYSLFMICGPRGQENDRSCVTAIDSLPTSGGAGS